jgi:acyl-CoA synthetase (AMP-forming)/AMP-acid ligase II
VTLRVEGLFERVAGVTERGIRFILSDSKEPAAAGTFVSYAELIRRAVSGGELLRQAGVSAGTHVLISARTAPEFVVAWLALLLARAVPVPIPPSNTLGGDVFSERVEPLLAHHRHLIADAEDIATLRGRATLDTRCLNLEAFAELAPAQGALTLPAVSGSDEAFVQYTSGSTQRPKGIVITYDNLVANLNAMRAALGHPGDEHVYVSWLPLYHDMGLVGFLLKSLLHGSQLVLVPPQYFVRRPTRFLRLLEATRASYSAMPNFAMGWLMRAHQRAPEAYDLRALRWWGVGSEPISYETLQRFAATFAESGLDPAALAPCYGLAESTLAVTMKRPGQPFWSEEHAGAAFPSNGPLVDGAEVRVARGDGELAGRLFIRGPSVARHAYLDGQKVPLLDAEGFLDTKDIGFFARGELIVLGRADEMFIVNGSNHFPYDIERVVCDAAGPDVARAVCFGVRHPDRTSAHAAVELRAAPADPAGLKDTIVASVRDRTGLLLESVLLIPPRSLPVTTSGKLRRCATRDLFQRGVLRCLTESA